MLTIRERLALPGQAEKLIWAGGDATPDTIGAADWGAKLFGIVKVALVAASLQAFIGVPVDEDVIIAVAELLCLVLLSVARAEAWSFHLIFYVSDNANTCRAPTA
jgi:hypothetical protein